MNFGRPPARRENPASKSRNPSNPPTEGKVGPKNALEEAENWGCRIAIYISREPKLTALL
jgi:hypothetical protein